MSQRFEFAPQRLTQFFNFGNNIYRAEFEIAAGDYEYKVATSDWDTYARAADPTPLDTPTPLDLLGEQAGPNGTIKSEERRLGKE